MRELLDFLLHYGYWVLFANVLLEQIGFPIPAVPVLLAMGALAGSGDFSLGGSWALAVTASLVCDLIWYRLGIQRGGRILGLVCRLSLEPDSCVSNTKTTFAKWGAYSFLFAKFVPGLGAVAAPMAGLTRMRMKTFLAADLTGAITWSGTYLWIGYLFRTELERAAESVSRLGGWLLAVIAGLLAAYIGWKYYQRRRFIRDLRVARIGPEELKDLIESEGVTIVDLRNALEFEFEGVKIPGAIWMDSHEVEDRHLEIPRDKDVVLYCS